MAIGKKNYLLINIDKISQEINILAHKSYVTKVYQEQLSMHKSSSVFLISYLKFSFSTCFQGSGLEDEPKMSIENWSEEDVSVWLCAQGLKDLVGIFKMNNIDGKELLSLTKHSLTNDLKIGKNVKAIKS